jgi:YD repeat-containing protein
VTGAYAESYVLVAPGTTRLPITATDPSGNSTTQSYDADQSGVSKTFMFDPNGNTTGDGTRTFEWNARNQLVSVKQGGVAIGTLINAESSPPSGTSSASAGGGSAYGSSHNPNYSWNYRCVLDDGMLR